MSSTIHTIIVRGYCATARVVDRSWGSALDVTVCDDRGAVLGRIEFVCHPEFPDFEACQNKSVAQRLAFISERLPELVAQCNKAWSAGLTIYLPLNDELFAPAAVLAWPQISHCPVCGYGPFQEPYTSAEQLQQSYDICHCCGCEYGYDDNEQHFHNWVKNGCHWFKPTAQQHNWSLEQQLKNRIRPWPQFEVSRQSS